MTRSREASSTTPRRSRRGPRAQVVPPAPLRVAAPWCLLTIACAWACGSAHPVAVDCGAPCDAATCAVRADGGASCGPSASDLPPRPRIRFNLQRPASDGDYPYSDAIRPADPAPLHSPVYLSATDSVDPEGAPITFFWNVQDPTGKYLGLEPDASAPRASFSPSLVGPHTITLEAVEAGGLHQIAQAMLALPVAPRPCAADGFSAPCSDELAVPGGSFLAGSTDDVGDPNEHPRHPAIVAPFSMDAYEVTVGRFRRFVNAYSGADVPTGAGAHPLIPGSGWQLDWNGFKIALTECGGAWTDEVGTSEARPVAA